MKKLIWLVVVLALVGCASGKKYFKTCERPGTLWECEDEVK